MSILGKYVVSTTSSSQSSKDSLWAEMYQGLQCSWKKSTLEMLSNSVKLY